MKQLIAILLSLISAHGQCMEKVTLQLKWMHQFQFAGFYAAKEKGYFEDAGFDVTIRERDVSTSPVDDVLDGRADFGIADSSIVLQRMSNLPVVIASTIYQSSPLVFMSLHSSKIKSPYELANKRIMFQRSVDDASLQAMLQLFNISESDYTLIEHNYNDYALIDDQADVMSAYASNQPYLYRSKGYEVNIIDPSSYGIDFYGDLIFTTEERVLNDIEGVRRFVSASLRGWTYALEHPEEVARLILDQYGSNSDLMSLLDEARITKSAIKFNSVSLGTMLPERFRRIADTYSELGLVENPSAEKSIEGLLLSDYVAKPLVIDSRITYSLLFVLLVIIAFAYSLFLFNKKLQRSVNEQTRQLARKSDQLIENLALLEERNNQLEVARNHADEANAAKSMFLANMSHEIRTPLNGVQGSLQILKGMALSSDAQRIVSTGLSSAKSLLTLINDILDFSKIEAGKLDLECIPFSLKELVGTIESELSPFCSDKNIALNIVVGPSYKDGWVGDPTRVKQILINICSNAIKFTEYGEVRITLDCQAIETTKAELVIQIKDTGIGMSEQEVEKLFHRFEQADNSTTRKYGGTGLGMAITHNLVALMHGRIVVHSAPGKGSQFDVYLPLPEAEIEGTAGQHESEAQAPKLDGKRVLLADDVNINQVIFESMIEPSGVVTTTVNNGQEALDLLDKESFDLIFLDIQMPVLDGMDTCRAIKRRGISTPLIALTANVMEQDVQLYQEIGFDDFLGKPLDMKDLYRVAKKYL